MARKNKIIVYALEQEARTLSGRGKSEEEIAIILTDMLGGKDTISQSGVNRFFLRDRKTRAPVANAVLEEYIQESLPKDLEVLDEMARYYLGLFRRGAVDIEELKKKKLVNIEDLQAAMKIDLRDRFAAGDRLHKIIETKLRFVGAGDGDEDDDLDSLMDSEEIQELREVAAGLARLKMREKQDQDAAES